MTLFLAVADNGGFSRAADALGMSQPAVSQAVGELEGELGTAMFHRLGRSVQLTAAGEALVGPARQALRDVDTGQAAVRAVAGLAAGQLDLSALPTLAVHPVGPIVGSFRRAHPGVRVVLSAPEDTASLVNLVRSGRSEVGITEAVTAPGLVVHSLGDQDFLMVLPPGSDARSPLPLRRLAGMPLVAGPPETSTRRLLDEAFTTAGLAPNVAVVTAQREALLPLVLAGAGATLLPRPLADLASRLGCVIASPTPAVRRKVVVAHRDTALTPSAERFVDMALAPITTTSGPSTNKPMGRSARSRHSSISASPG
ncbi:MAG TPA: LysR substrate-binding domain-containing protein [Acidimicrobiales bacterium]